MKLKLEAIVIPFSDVAWRIFKEISDRYYDLSVSLI
jgi:hypothetical protein